MIKRKNTHGLMLSIGTALCLSLDLGLPAVFAADAPAVSEQAVSQYVTAMEKRFFSRQYQNDPLEKRLERLELLVFGSTQGGENAERYQRLKKSIADRSSEQSHKTAKGAPEKPASGKSSQYPIVGTLEWRVLHKTYGSEPLSERLSRLEKKVFGSENPSMAYVDRVDRLKRTLGVGAGAGSGTVAQQPMPATSPLGPAPKARPRGQMGPEGWGYGFSTPPIIGDNRDMFGERGGAFGLSPGGLGLPNGITNMLKEMDRQLMQMNQMPPGQYSYDPKSGAWIERNTGKRVKPDGQSGQQLPMPFKSPGVLPRTLPLPFGSPHNDSQLPPYSDPNSI